MRADSQPMPKKRRLRRGATFIEFTLLGIPAIFLFTSIAMCSIDMWQFYTLSYAVQQTARYAALHGISCTQNGNSCQVTRAQVATTFENAALALVPASTTVYLTDGSGTITCAPVSSCPSSGTYFPANSYNSTGSNITVKATYSLTNPIFMYWPGSGSSGVAANTFTVAATSTQEILF
jgi:Flp pilus assembly protein TadG